MLSSCIRYEGCFFYGFDVIQIYCKYHQDFMVFFMGKQSLLTPVFLTASPRQSHFEADMLLSFN